VHSRKSMLEATRKRYVQGKIDEFAASGSLPCLQGRVGVSTCRKPSRKGSPPPNLNAPNLRFFSCRKLLLVIPAKAHYCPARVLRTAARMQCDGRLMPFFRRRDSQSAMNLMAVIPAKAGRSAQRGEHPKDGPEGVSEANHPFALMHPEKWIPAFAGMTAHRKRALYAKILPDSSERKLESSDFGGRKGTGFQLSLE